MSKRRPRGKGTMRRAYLKTFSGEYINTGHSVDTFRIQDSPAFHYTARAKGLGFEEEFLAVWERLFGFPVRTEPPQVSAARQAALDKAEALRQGLPAERHCVLARGSYTCLKLFFTDDHKLWFFMEERWKPLKISKSITYSSRERAMTVFLKGTIRWKEHFIPVTAEISNGNKDLQLREANSVPTP